MRSRWASSPLWLISHKHVAATAAAACRLPPSRCPPLRSPSITPARPRQVADLPALKARLAELDAASQAPDLWDRPGASPGVLLQQLGALQGEVAALERFCGQLEDLAVALELLEMEVGAGAVAAQRWSSARAVGACSAGQCAAPMLIWLPAPQEEAAEAAAAAAEAGAICDGLDSALETWELQRLLGGPYDARGAVISIQAGAGGTDAQDWAEMLERMYLRWAEQQGHRTRTLDRQQGVGWVGWWAQPGGWAAGGCGPGLLASRARRHSRASTLSPQPPRRRGGGHQECRDRDRGPLRLWLPGGREGHAPPGAPVALQRQGCAPDQLCRGGGHAGAG